MSVLRNATVEVKGNNERGEAVTLTGNLKDVTIKDTTPGEAESSIWYLSDRHLLRPRTYSLDFTPDVNGHYYRVKTEHSEVIRTARVEASDRSVEGLENARRRAGAPENAKVHIEGFARAAELVIENLDEPAPVWVEFRWKD